MKIKKVFSLISYNILLFLIFVSFIEIFFGFWFSKNNFGYIMRSERNKKIHFTINHHNNVPISFIHKRNFYGFIGEEINPKDVKIIFQGGSTGAEIWKPRKDSIVENLNTLLKNNGFDKKIYNTSVNGKSIRGYIYDFDNWFKKIPNFNPEIVIFYLGINDRYYIDDDLHRFHDFQHSSKQYKIIRDYIKNNSFFLYKYKTIENRYFPKNIIRYEKTKENLYNNYHYINYHEAKKNFTKINVNDVKHLEILNSRLDDLKKTIELNEIQPIFITQIKFDGLSKRLFLVNEEIKKFAIENNYKLIPLDELISNIGPGDFFDEYHTTISGSKKISDVIYKHLDFD